MKNQKGFIRFCPLVSDEDPKENESEHICPYEENCNFMEKYIDVSNI